MAWMEVRAPAKVNLFLELIERRGDGFHELETIMTRIGLFDRLFFRKRSDHQIRLGQLPTDPVRNRRTSYSMPLDRTNLVWQAVDELRRETGQDFGVDIAIQKNIPAQAGLGGGSSDAATTLKAVNVLLGLKQTPAKLAEIGNRLGSDIGFFLASATARCTGRGERVESLPNPPTLWTVLAMPPDGLSTATVFKQSSVVGEPVPGNTMTRALAVGRLRDIGRNLFNRLQIAATGLCPWIDRLEHEFNSIDCPGHQMTGSGAGYFGLFASHGMAGRAMRCLSARVPEALFYCVPTPGNMGH